MLLKKDSAAIAKDYPPRKIVSYPIPGDSKKGGALFIYGDEKAKNIAFISPGFPDDHGVFLPFASRLASETDTLVGVTCLPGYDDREDKRWIEHKRQKPDGYTFEEAAAALREAAKALFAESACPSKPKITGIFHDWGSLVGNIWAKQAMAENSSSQPDQLVYFDVMVPAENKLRKDITDIPKRSLYQGICAAYYQICFALAFVVQKFLHSSLALLTIFVGLVPVMIIPIRPLYKIDTSIMAFPSPFQTVYMFYTYYHLWKKVLALVIFGEKFGTDYLLPADLSKVPILFLYGKEKRAIFHDKITVKVLEREHKEKRSKSNAICIEDVGHWLYLQKADECFEHIKNFMLTEN